MQYSKKKILKYTTLPGFIPRIIALLSSGFSNIALYIANIYRLVGLLDQNHPYLNPQNTGRFTIRHVIGEARRNLVFKKENIDQIVVFFLILIGLVALAIQIVLFCFALLTPLALAAGPPLGWGAYLGENQDPTYDIAFMMLDRVFGYPDIFGSCISQGIQCQIDIVTGNVSGPTQSIPNNFHNGLHALLRFYNLGILAIGMILVIYTIIAVVGETAQSGVPFGQRFNGFWGPVRLIAAIGLLVPVTHNLNTCQYIGLKVAKVGSNFATNAWDTFRGSLTSATLLGDPQNIVVTPEGPSIAALNEFMFVALACEVAEFEMRDRDIEPFVIINDDRTRPFTGSNFRAIRDDIIANGGDQIIIRFGEYDPNGDDTGNPNNPGNDGDPVIYDGYTAGVKPICGELHMSIQDAEQPGALRIQEEYYDIIYTLWTDNLHLITSEAVVYATMPNFYKDPGNGLNQPNADYVRGTLQWLEDQVDAAVAAGVIDQINASGWNRDYGRYGWGGAAIWYNTVAEFNGSLISSTYAIPSPYLYPYVMEHVLEEKKTYEDSVDGIERFKPILSGGNIIDFETELDMNMATILYEAQQFWGGRLGAGQLQPDVGSNFFLTGISKLFGLDGLLNLQKNTDIHPLAQLVGIGRSLIESSIQNFAGSTATLIAGWGLGSQTLSTASGFLSQVAMIGLSIGFVLYYVVPFLPFIYFFFAVGGWVKGIFEAMVGLPLWALSHIRVDGEGLPGPTAMNGYYLLFEIFLRPVLIVVGLLGGIIVFSTQVTILNEIWQLVTSNVTGFSGDIAQGINTAPPPPPTSDYAGVGDPLGAFSYISNGIEQFFFTILYAIIAYMMALSSFKLIDLIPNYILRWMNASVPTFGEQVGDPAGSLIQYSYIGSSQILGQMGEGVNSITSRLQIKK